VPSGTGNIAICRLIASPLLVSPGGTLADIKGMWRDRELGEGIDRWSL